MSSILNHDSQDNSYDTTPQTATSDNSPTRINSELITSVIDEGCIALGSATHKANTCNCISDNYLKSENEYLKSRISHLQAICNNHVDTNAQHLKSLSDIRNDVSIAKANYNMKVQEYTEAVSVLEDTITRHEATITKLQDTASGRLNALINLRNNSNELHKQLTRMVNDNDGLHKALDFTNAHCDRLRKVIAYNSNCIESHNKQIKTLEDIIVQHIDSLTIYSSHIAEDSQLSLIFGGYKKYMHTILDEFELLDNLYDGYLLAYPNSPEPVSKPLTETQTDETSEI